MANYKVIHGVEVDLEHPDFEHVKNVTDLKKSPIFEHLSKPAQEAAHKDLVAALKGKSVEETPAEEPAK